MWIAKSTRTGALIQTLYKQCAEDQDRTGDPSLFRGMLYQLSYLGIYFQNKLTHYSTRCMLSHQNSYLGIL